MGAYLAIPVTTKERFEGGGVCERNPIQDSDADALTLLYGGAAMQGWRRTMEDAHIAELCRGKTGTHDSAVFGVFDGHGGAEVALFCQRYMAQELQKLESYAVQDVEQSLVDVFHRMDDMLRDHSFADEIEQLKTRDATEDDEQQKGDDDGVSPMDALEMIKRVFQLKRFIGENGQPAGGDADADAAPAAASAADEAVAMDDDTDGPSGREQQQAERQQADADKEGGAPGPGPSSQQQQARQGGPGAGQEQQQEQQQERYIEPADARIQAGCTAVVAVIKGGHLYVANAGDSRGVLCRGGTAVAMSEDHKPAQESEKNRILNAGGFLSEIGGVCRVNGNLNLSRAIGDLKYKTNQTLEAKDQIITAQPDVRKELLHAEDEFLLLACDGVWDVMTNQQAVDFVRSRLAQGMAPTDAACELLDECLANDPKEARGVGCDNMTAIVVQLRQGRVGASAAASAPAVGREPAAGAAAAEAPGVGRAE